MSAYSQAVTNARPVAYWRLNETNGTTAVDFVGFHNGTFTNSVTPGVSGPQSPAFPGFETNNTAMQFNYTTGSYLTMPALNLNTNTVTITGWINPTGTQAGWSGIAFCRGGNTCAGLHFGPGSIANELRYTWNNSRWDKGTGLAVPTNQWSFVALVVTPTNATIYLGTNGVLNSSNDTVNLPSQAFDASLLVGFDPSSGSRLFKGVIDEVAIYNHSLTPAQIQQLYASALAAFPPASPSELTATAVSTNQINLSWSDNSADEEGFKIERASDNGGSAGTWTQIATVGANLTNYMNSGLLPDTLYWYRVRAHGLGGDSEYSNQANAKTLPLLVAPSNLTATAVSANQINLSWTDNSNNEEGFKIERSVDGTNFVQVAQPLPNTTSYRNTGLWPDRTYYYRVRAHNAIGHSDFSSVAGASTPTMCPSGIVGWGYNSDGQASPPSGLTGIVAVAASFYHSLALRSDGSVIGWGDNSYGETAPPLGLTGAAAIAAGYYYSLVLKSDGIVVAWGDDTLGQVTPPPGLSNVVAISAGGRHSLALKSDGTVVGWGWGSYGQATPPPGLKGVVAVAGGYDHSLALRSDGTVIGWGWNGYGQTTPPTGLSNVVAIAAGGHHSLALKSDGTLVCWGADYYGQITLPAGLSNVVAIAGGLGDSLALKSDGSLVGWGDNTRGQSTPPTGLSGVVVIAAGSLHNLALACLPAAPSTLTATTFSSSQINLSWIDHSSTETGFKIERAPNVGDSPGTWTQIATVGANVTNYNNTGLSYNTRYWYRVRAYNPGGNSDYSNPASATTLQQAPAAPSGLIATTVSSNQINLTWSDASDNEDGFKIERVPDSGGTWTQIAVVATNVTAYGDSGLLPGTKYWYRVRAYNAVGNSAYSSQKSATTLPVRPAAPVGLTATATYASRINLSWTDKSNNEAGFKIERAPDNGGSPGAWIQAATVSSNLTVYSDTTLSANTTCWYRVRAYNVSGDSDYSNEASATIPSLPSSPSGLTAVPGKQINLSWFDNANNEDGFKIERGPSAVSAWTQIATVGANVTNYLSTGLISNTVYWYRVRAYNVSGDSDYSNEANATTPNLAAPSGLTTAVVSTNELKLFWRDNTNAEDGFEIERASDNFGTPVGWMQIAVIGANVTNFNNVGLTANTKYWYRIRAFQSSYSSDYSTQASGITPALCPRVVFGWGGNGDGQATPPAGLEWATSIAAGWYHGLALKADGTVVGWGDNSSGQATPPPGLTGVVAIAAGRYHSLALKSDGTVIGWGYSYNATPPPGLSNVVAITAGSAHSLALRANGTLVGWGSSGYGETIVPSFLTNVVAIAAGPQFSMALKSDGTVFVWGGYPPTPPTDLINVVAIAAGNSHGIALKGDRTVVGWGNNYYGETNVPAGLSNVVDIAAYGNHSLALKSDGTVVGWGDNSAGQRNPPSGLAPAVAIAAGYYHSLALITPCSLSTPAALSASAISSTQIKLSWLDNSPDEHGFKIERAPDNNGIAGSWSEVTTVNTNVTIYVDLGLAPNTTYWYRIKAYNAEGTSSYTDPASTTTWNLTPPSALTAITTNQIVLSWIDNNVNEDGFEIERAPDNGGAAGSWTPIATVVSNTTTYTDTGLPVETRYWYRVRAYNSIGLSDYSEAISVIILLPPTDLIAIPVSPTQINLSWTNHSSSQTGFKIERSADGINFKQIAQVLPNTTTYRNTGLWPDTTYYYQVRACNAGSNSDSSNVTSATTPTLCTTSIVGWGSGYPPPTNLTGVVAIADGYNHSLALKSDGTLISWGSNSYGQRNSPAGLSNAVAIAAGYNYSLALKSNGAVISWGYNTYGVTNYPGISNAVAVAAGYYHALALRSDGVVVGWGRNDYGQATPRPGLSGVVAIAAGTYHSVALKSDGTVVVWGRNNYGQTNAPAGLAGVVAIAAGYYHNLALKSDGTVVGWGDNAYGQSTPPTNLAGVVAVAAGSQHSLGLRSDGSVTNWGSYGTPPVGLTGVVAIAAGYDHGLALSCAPSAPVGLTATGGVSQIDVSWRDTANTEDRSGIESGASWTGPWTEIGSVDSNVTNYSDMGLTCGQTNYYRVRAYNSMGGSPYSYSVSARASPNDTDCDGIPNTWTQQYFGHSTGEDGDNSRATDDADGDGQSNLPEFMAGTDPTNSVSAFHILEIAALDEDVLLTWSAVGGKWYTVQTTTNFTGGLSNSFYDLNPVIIAPGTGEFPLTVLHLGAATNVPLRLYRVRLVP